MKITKMKFLSILFLIGILTVSFRYMEEEQYPTLKIGDVAPNSDVKMKDVNGKEYSLSDLKMEKGLLVIFSCNSCPFVVGNGEGSEGWQGRYNELYDLSSTLKIGMVLVNSNEAKREGDDSFENMKTHAKEQAYKSHYVMDKNSDLANAFGAKTTPHVFLFDKDMKLVYKGSIDDNVKSSKDVKDAYLKIALRLSASGNEIKNNETKAMGCSIKRVNK
jgi:thioredoxin-related protein